jgi:hypothetical protein
MSPKKFQSESHTQITFASAIVIVRIGGMADDKKQRAQQDAARTNVNEDYEVQYWTTAGA